MNKTAKAFSIVTGFSILTRLLSFIFKIWISRALGAETVGLYQIAMSVLMMLFTLTSGAPTVLSRKIAEANGDIRKQNSLTVASLILGFVVAAPLALILFLLRDKVGFLFSDKRCLPLFLIMLPTLVTSTAYASLRSWFWGRKNFLAFSSTELIDEVVKIALSALFAGGLISALDGASGVALAMTLSDLICVLILFALYFIAGGRICKPTGFKDLVSRSLPLSATRMITSLTTSATALVIPQMLVKYGMSVSDATASYGRVAGMALPLIMAPIMFVSALSVVLIPDMAELKSRGDLVAVRSKLAAATIFALIISAFFFSLYLPLGRHLGLILFKDAQAGEIVSYCSALLFPVALAQVTTPMLNSLGKEKNTFLHSLIGSVSIIPCIFLLPKYVGVYATAIGSAICFTLISALNCIVLKREVGNFVNFKKVFKLFATTVPIALIGFFSERVLSSLTGSYVTIAVIGVFVVFFTFICLSAFDIADVTAYIKLLRPTGILRKRRSSRRANRTHKKSA